MKNELPEQQYIDALLNDFKQSLAALQGRSLSSIFIGGGTPSLFSADAIAYLLTNIDILSPLPSNIEITLEANPGTAEQQRFTGFRQAGINRLSLGIQSLRDESLQYLGRIHSAQEARNAVHMARVAGFNNLNIDMMFGLPKQTAEQALEDLQQGLALQTEHFSWYQLTLEPNTLFYAKPPPLPDDEIIWQMHQQGQQLLAKQGYQQYEVSAYAKQQQHCQHNINYWQFGDYLGIGAGAHSKLTDTQTHRVLRLSQVKNPRDYLSLAKNTKNSETIVSEQQQCFEFMLNALRLNQPIEFSLFEQRTGLSIHFIKKTLALAEQKGLLIVNNNTIAKTELGTRFLNDTVELFLA